MLDHLGIVDMMLVGVAGAVIGGLFGAGCVTGFDFRSFPLAIIGSLAVLFCCRSFSARTMT